MKLNLLPLALFLCSVALVQPGMSQTSFSGTTMGPIVYNVTIADDIADAAKLERQIEERLQQVNALMSTYIADSDVSRINQANAKEWVSVDPMTWSMIQKSIELSKATRGAFDITVGPAVEAWNFGPNRSPTRPLPGPDEIKALKRLVGISKIETRRSPPAVRKVHRATRIDLSAIAKGLAVDRVATLLTEQSIGSFMVEVGGEVVVRGKAQGGRNWRIGIEQPNPGSQRSVAEVVLLENQAMATSGDYRNFHLVDGKKYSHTINPLTCMPVDNQMASAAVVAEDCATADAIATALMVLGPRDGLEICDELGLHCFLHEYEINSTSEFKTSSSPAFPLQDKNIESESASIWPAFIGALVIFGLAISGMAVGAIFNNRPITGSCGGIAAGTNEDGSTSCSLCHKPVAECPEKQAKAGAESVANPKNA